MNNTMWWTKTFPLGDGDVINNKHIMFGGIWCPPKLSSCQGFALSMTCVVKNQNNILSFEVKCTFGNYQL